MKKQFSGFYSPSDVEIKNSWSDENTLFVFDTNVLLNLYGYTEETREDFFKILEKISTNIWIPYHVGLEYQRNRLKVVMREKNIFSLIEKYIKSIEEKVNNDVFKNLKLTQRLPEVFKKSEELHSKIDKLFSEYRESIKDWNDKQPDVRSTDIIRKKIDELFNEKVGNSFTEQKQLEEIFKEGEERYKNNVPPGYKDEKEKKNEQNFVYSGLSYIPMYGDLIVWKQIIEKSKEENIKSVIFVTDDVKEDWWYILDSNGKKEIGVRAELREEIYKESNISSFEVLRTTDFMKNGKEFLELDVQEESIVETKINIESKKSKLRLRKEELDLLRNFSKEHDIYTSELRQALIRDKNSELTLAKKIKVNWAEEVMKIERDKFSKISLDSWTKLQESLPSIDSLLEGDKHLAEQINLRYQLCFCGSGKFVQDCCLKEFGGGLD